MATELSIACAVHDRTIADRYLVPSLDGLEGDVPVRFLLDNEANAISSNVAHLYNLLARLDGPPIRIFAHPDLTFPGDFTGRIAEAVEILRAGNVGWGALGVVGRSWQGDYLWGHEVDEPAAVCTLDACCVVVDTRHGLWFDDRTFDGYHCFVEDYCMQCHAAGRGVFVVPSRCEHISVTYAREGSRWGGYPKYRRRLQRKWRRRYPNLTTT